MFFFTKAREEFLSIVDFDYIWDRILSIFRSNSPLTLALHDDNMELVNTLLAAGANVNHIDKNGYSPLTLASLRGDTDLVNSLLAAGAKVNHIDKDGYSPLTIAVSLGKTEVVNALLAAGANVNHVDNVRKFSALMHASHHGHTDSVNALLAAGANVNYVDKNGDGALAVASWGGHTDVVRLLLIKGRPIITAECVRNVVNAECEALIEKYRSLSLIATIASAAPLTLLRKAKAEQQGNSPYVAVPAVSKIHSPNLGPGEGWAHEMFKMLRPQPG